MKNKLSKLLVTIPLMFVLTGCSFLNDILNGGENEYSYKEVKKVKELDVDRENRKVDYVIGDTFVKPTVIATYEDGTTEDVTSKAEFTGYNMNVAGTQKVTVKYDNWTLTYEITVVESGIGKTAKNIDLPDGYKGKYVQGDTFVKPSVVVTYEDGTTEDVTAKAEFTGYNMNVVGTQKVTVKYDNWTLTYEITVVESGIGKTAKDIDLPDGYKGKYVQGDTFVKPKVVATFTDDTQEDVTEYCTFTTPNMNLIGKQEVKLTFQRFSLSFNIEIREKYAQEQEGCYLSDYNKTLVVGEPYRFYYFRKKDGEEDTKFDNEFIYLKGTSYSIEDNTIASINEHGEVVALKAGETYVHCINKKEDGEIKFDFRCLLKVEDKHITKLEILNYRDKYYTGHQFNFMCKAIATYQTGYQEEVTPTVDSSKVNMSIPGTYNITLSYTVNGTTMSVNKTVSVLDSSLFAIEKTPLDFHMVDYYKNSRGVYAMPTKGDVKMLVIPVKFNETNNYIANYSNVRSDINDMFFGANEKVGWRSVETFYEEESKGLLNIIGKTSDWYDSGLSYKDCFDADNIAQLRTDVTEWYFTNNPTEDRKSYDADHDGFIDGLCLIYGCPDYMTGDFDEPGASNLWAMVRTMGVQPNVNKPVSIKFMWMSYDTMYPTKAKALERTGKSDYSESDKYGNASNRDYLTLDTRTAIHESGHMLGLFDYYSSTESNGFPAGHSNIQTLNILSHDPYSLLQYDWANPYIPEFSQTITITDFQDNHDVIMLKPNHGLVNSTFDEYILVDLYAPTGLNKFYSVDHPMIYGPNGKKDDLTTVGVRIWHVDARLLTRESGYTEFTTDPTIPSSFYISNSYDEDNSEVYREFYELKLVRNNPDITYRELSYNVKSDYFYEGDTFDMSKFPKQFANGTKLDSGLDLGWSISVDGIYQTGDKYTADITVTKL